MVPYLGNSPTQGMADLKPALLLWGGALIFPVEVPELYQIGAGAKPTLPGCVPHRHCRRLRVNRALP